MVASTLWANTCSPLNPAKTQFSPINRKGVYLFCSICPSPCQPAWDGGWGPGDGSVTDSLSSVHSLHSCGHAWDAVTLQPGSSHDHCLLPLHVHGVGVSDGLRGLAPASCAPANRSLGVDPCCFPQSFRWIFRRPSVPHSKRPSVEERSLLCKCPQPPPGVGGS